MSNHTNKRIRLHGLRQSTVGHTSIGLWRHPDSRAHEYKDLNYWIETAQILERALADLSPEVRARVLAHAHAQGYSADPAARGRSPVTCAVRSGRAAKATW